MLAQEQLALQQTVYRDLKQADREEVARLLLLHFRSESTRVTYAQIRSLVHEALLGHLFGIVAEHNGSLCGVAIYGLKRSAAELLGRVVTIAIDQGYVDCGIQTGLSNAVTRQLEAVGIGLNGEL